MDRSVEKMMRTNLKISASIKVNALAISIVTFVLLLSGCGKEESSNLVAPVIKLALTEVVSEQAADNLSFNGIVRAAERADLSFRVNGRLIDIFVREGDHVQQGQVLALLDPSDASNTLDSALLEQENTRLEYTRAQAIYDISQAISKSDLDTISTRFKLAKNRVVDATLKLEYTKLTAPFNGIIGRKLVDNYIQIQANAPILTLHDLNDLEVVVNIPHKVMLSSRNATKANAELSAIHGQIFPLLLRTYGTQADPVSQTYPVVLGFEDLKGFRVLPGMAVKVIPVNTDTSSMSLVLTVPLTAVVPDNQGKQYIWVVNSKNITEKRFILVGALSKNRIQVNSNLAVGERVIIAGVSSVKEGMKVRPYITDDTGV